MTRRRKREGGTTGKFSYFKTMGIMNKSFMFFAGMASRIPGEGERGYEHNKTPAAIIDEPVTRRYVILSWEKYLDETS